jgi:MFS family permease
LKNKQAIYLLFAANSVSGFSQGISIIAIPWYFSNVINQPSVFGYVYFSITFISLFWGIYAGSLIDRYNRRNIFIANSVAGCLIILSIALSGFMLGSVPAALVAVAFATTFFIFNIHYPNLYAFCQEISDPKDYSRITSYIEIQGQVTTALAGAVAGILLTGTEEGHLNMLGFHLDVAFQMAPWTIKEILVLDGSTYIVAIILILLIRFTPVQYREPDYTSVANRVRTGLQYLRRNPMLLIFGITSYAIFITILVLIFFLLPVYIDSHLNGQADVYGAAEMYFAIGSVGAGIAVNYIFRNTTTVKAIIIMTLTATAIYFIYIFNTYIPLFYMLYFLLGMSNAGTRVMRMTYLLNHVPNDIIGRASSVLNVAGVFFRLLFIIVCATPFFMNNNNVVWAFLMFGCFTMLSAIVLIINYSNMIGAPTYR